jgi:hypothetical protein
MAPVEHSWVTNYQKITVKMKDGTVITGQVNKGESARVSDLFRHSPADYIVLSDADVRGEGRKVVLINTSEIMWVELDSPDS